MKSEFNIKLEGIKEALKLVDPETVKRAAKKAVDDVAKMGLTEAKRHISSEYNIRPNKILQYFRLRKMRRNTLEEATITARGMGIPLAMFDAKQIGVKIAKGVFKYTKRAKTQGNLSYGGSVSVLVKRSGGRKIVSQKGENKPFLQVNKRGRLVIWERKGKERFPVTEYIGPGVAHVFRSEKVMSAIKKLINEKFKPRFEYWLEEERKTK
jgi:hypothetical protein